MSRATTWPTASINAWTRNAFVRVCPRTSCAIARFSGLAKILARRASASFLADRLRSRSAILRSAAVKDDAFDCKALLLHQVAIPPGTEVFAEKRVEAPVFALEICIQKSP